MMEPKDVKDRPNTAKRAWASPKLINFGDVKAITKAVVKTPGPAETPPSTPGNLFEIVS